jgi:hypothetical protein
MRKLTAATSDMMVHVLAHRELGLSLPGETVKEWTAAVVAWEMDPTKPNPFEMQFECTSSFFGVIFSFPISALIWFSPVPTQAAVRRELAEAEALDLAAGKDFTLDANISPSVFVSSGLDLEAEQYVFFSSL